MCGIYGFAGFSDKELLIRMSNITAHRGPDDFGLWESDTKRVSLGHNRLSIIDLSPQGHQPMFNEDGRLVLVFNGEIYNFQDFRRDLIEKGHKFISNTDSEVILHLYEEEGHDFLKKLRGMFAFALYDREKDELFLARDHYGIKPLYFAPLEDRFIFASELKAITEYTDLPKKINLEAVNDYITFLWTPFTKTMFKDVQKLAPGHGMVVKEGRVDQVWKFYEVGYSGNYLDVSDEQAVDMLDKILEDSVRAQMVSDVPLGAFLSGGLDSSLIVAYMRKISGDVPVKTFTIDVENIDDEGFVNDLYYAEKVAKYLNVELERISVAPDDLLAHVESLPFMLDEPQADPAPINAMLIAGKAIDSGCKVLLSGAGGDDYFTGYRRHIALEYDRKIMKLPAVFRKLISVLCSRLRTGNPKMRKLRKYTYNLDRDMSGRIASYFAWIEDSVKHPLFTEKGLLLMNGYDPLNRLKQTLDILPDDTDILDKMLFLDNKHFLADHNLNYTDKSGMVKSLEVRVPYIDEKVVEFSAKLPPHMKLRNGETKWILKKVAERYLPHDVIYRPKTGFGAPIRTWIKKDMLPMLEKYLSRERLEQGEIFDYDAVWRLIHDNRNGKVDATYTIFSILCIEIWKDRFGGTL